MVWHNQALKLQPPSSATFWPLFLITSTFSHHLIITTSTSLTPIPYCSHHLNTTCPSLLTSLHPVQCHLISIITRLSLIPTQHPQYLLLSFTIIFPCTWYIMKMTDLQWTLWNCEINCSRVPARVGSYGEWNPECIQRSVNGLFSHLYLKQFQLASGEYKTFRKPGTSSARIYGHKSVSTKLRAVSKRNPGFSRLDT
jgi:hypothetical protein